MAESIFIKFKQAVGTWAVKKIQKYGPHKVQVLGKSYEISEDVFNPKFSYTSEFMARHIKVAPGDEVLDMGTGCGIQAITAAQVAKKVIAVDINPHAALFAKKNVVANGLEDVVSVIQGDLFSSLRPGYRFNVIIFTPPYFEGMPKTDFEYALYDPGKKLTKRFFRVARDYLEPDGYVQMVYTSIAYPEEVLEISSELGWESALIAQERSFMEKFLIYRLTLK